MKYMLLVCWDAEQMDAQTEPGPDDTPDQKSFPWLDDVQARGVWLTGDQLAPQHEGAEVAKGLDRRHGGSSGPGRGAVGPKRTGRTRPCGTRGG